MSSHPTSVPATIDETAEHFRISRRQVQYLIKQGVLVPYGGLGRSVRIDLNEADAALKGARGNVGTPSIEETQGRKH